MKKNLVFIVSFLLLIAFGGLLRAQGHNIRADSVGLPPRTSIAISTDIMIQFTNTGGAESDVPLEVIISDPTGVVVIRDTAVVGGWQAGTSLDVTFASWVPVMIGDYTICGIALLATDENHLDDTTCVDVLAVPTYDAEADSIVNPQPNEVKAFGSRWQPAAVFRAVGVSDLFDIPATVMIWNNMNGVLAFQSDSLIPELNIDEGLIRFDFPSILNSFDIATLSPGCYKLAAFTRFPGDGNLLNDTAWTTFCIASGGVLAADRSEDITILPNLTRGNITISNIPEQIFRNKRKASL